MIGIYVLVAIFYQFSPPSILPDFLPGLLPNFSFVSPQSSNSAVGSEIELVVDKLNGVRIGTPVVMDGAVVGSVASIQSEGRHPKKAPPKFFNIKLNLENVAEGDLRSGAIGIVTSPISRLMNTPRTVVELINPKDGDSRPSLQSDEKLRGFGSLSDFWASPRTVDIL